MRTLLSDTLTPLLPLQIREATHSDPVLTLTGDQWSFAAVCPWRVRRTKQLWFSWSSGNAADLTWELIGHTIHGIRFPAGTVDPIFDLSGELSLEIFADTDFDPWTLRLPSHTFVGSASQV